MYMICIVMFIELVCFGFVDLISVGEVLLDVLFEFFGVFVFVVDFD